jgi:hypothetical protein
VDPLLFVRVIVDLDGAVVGDLSDLSLFEGGSFASPNHGGLAFCCGTG